MTDFASFIHSDSESNVTATISSTIVTTDSFSVAMNVITCLSWLVAILPLIVSPFCAYLLHLKRNCFPIKHFNIYFLITAELTVPIGVWGVIIFNICPEWPCWISLLGWDTIYFPLLTIVIISIVKLRLDYDFCQQSVGRGNLTSDLSSLSDVRPRTDFWNRYIVPACTLVTGGGGGTGSRRGFKKVLRIVLRVVLALCFWLEGWLSVIPRAIRAFEYWQGPASAVECNTFTNYDVWMDIVNVSTYTLVVLLLSKYLLRPVREVLGIRKRFLSVATVVLCMALVQDTFALLVSIISDENTLSLAYALLALYGAVMWNLVTYTLSLPLIKEVYRQARLAADITAANAITKKSLLSLLLEYDSNDDNNARVAEEFRNYLLLELCVENAEYLLLSLAFKKAETDEARFAISKKIVETHLIEDRRSPKMMVLNLGDQLKKRILLTYETQGHLPDFWQPVDEEVISMLMEPYIRFRRRRKLGIVHRTSSIAGPSLALDVSTKSIQIHSTTPQQLSRKKSAGEVFPS